ncbi:proton pump-interactor 1-like [Senna tora]|uniref:Proton pump-interactor 1-like n=1 Tax=Senna tora TaxID=362788 RepID=A0A835CCJ5_9FABA|nr:proton pump-interactor 1-like [Senna tora]
MAVEVVGFEMVQGPVENGSEGDKSVLVGKENGNIERDSGIAAPIQFGSHVDEPVKGAKVEENGVSDSSVPKDAVEEWPAPKQIHSFYFVRFRPFEDPNIKSKIDQLDKEISKKNQTRFQITEAIRAKRSERAELITQIKTLRDDSRQFRTLVDEKIKEIEPLQQALGKLRSANNGSRGGGGLCSSEEELNDVVCYNLQIHFYLMQNCTPCIGFTHYYICSPVQIYSLKYRIQHESIPLAEEKQLLREIKQLEGTREKVVANAAMRAKLQDSMGQKEAIQDQVKLIGGDLDGAKKERQLVRSKINKLDDALKVIDNEIKSLQDELTGVTQKRESAYESIQKLRKQRDEGNTYFYQSRTVLNKARELAAKKDINALEELSQKEVDKFISLWSNDKAFRDDYEKRLLQSLDIRQLSRDGRMRNPDEKPLLEEPKPAEAAAQPKTSVKQQKEEPKSSPQDTLPAPKVQKETVSKGKSNPDNNNKDVEETEEYDFVKPQKEAPVKEPEIDPSKLKEMKREEEIAKAKQALERKKKLAEKAAAKAALRAQKEAEKKLKEREKKAKKKAAASAPATNPEEPEAEAEVESAEQEKVTDVAEAAPAKEKVQKETNIRSRSRTKGPEAIPKAILKRKRSNNYWIWIASGALLVVLLALLAYNYQSLI